MRTLALAAVVAFSTITTASAQHANVSPIIYLERCVGGCLLRKGVDDARGYTSTLLVGDETEFNITEFKNSAGASGPAADAEWDAIVQCVKEVYSPFNVEVTDVKPTAPTYHMDIVAGVPAEIGRSGIGGISPGVGCQPADNRITFTFANTYRSSNIQRRVWEVCAVVAQESAHSYGLDHAYAFGNRSACNDPMTYRGDCGGQKFFRNDQATCGEFQPAQSCACGITQNAHLLLLNVFGPGTPITAKPTITIKQPAPGATTITNGATVIATAAAQRGIKTVELWINGYKWASAIGAQWGSDGQPETDYGIPIPAGVPDGVMDLVIKAKDDIDVATDAPTITVTKGAPCASADACLAGQKCEAGKCFWDPPSGELGDECTFPQYCLSGVCTGTSDRQICTRECVVGVVDSCDPGFTCIETSPNKGVCFDGPVGEDDGWCSASAVGEEAGGQGSGAPVGALMLSLIGLALVIPRRRRLR